MLARAYKLRIREETRCNLSVRHQAEDMSIDSLQPLFQAEGLRLNLLSGPHHYNPMPRYTDKADPTSSAHKLATMSAAWAATH